MKQFSPYFANLLKVEKKSIPKNIDSTDRKGRSLRLHVGTFNKKLLKAYGMHKGGQKVKKKSELTE